MDKQELKNYMWLNAELKRLEDKVTELKNAIEKPKSPVWSDMPRGGISEDIGDKVLRLIELKDKYNAQWDKVIDEKKRIETAIYGLDDIATVASKLRPNALIMLKVDNDPVEEDE